MTKSSRAMKAMAREILFLPGRKALVYKRQESLRSRRPSINHILQPGTACKIIKADPLGSWCAIRDGKNGKSPCRAAISQKVSFSGSLHVSPLNTKSAFALAEFANCISVFNLRCIRSYNKKRPQRKEINES